MLPTLIYRRFGERLEESCDSVDAAMSRAVELLLRNEGVPLEIRTGAGVLDQEAIFTEYAQTAM